MKFNLTKQAERVQFVLKKRDLPSMRASVGLCLDVSDSTKDLYNQGVIQRVVEQVVPIAMKCDDNANLDIYTFSSESMTAQLTGVTPENYVGFVEREIINNPRVPKWRGTDYSHVLNEMLDDYGFYGGGSSYNKSLNDSETGSKSKGGFFANLLGNLIPPAKKLQSESASGEAVVIYFITDGENSDQLACYQLLQAVEMAKCNIYFLLIGVGNASFHFIEKLGTDFGNVGFLNIQDLQHFIDSDDLYEKLLPEEMINWLKQRSA